MLKIKETSRTVWRDIDLKEAGTFRLQLQRPTWEQLNADAERLPGYLEARLQNCVVGWEGVEINGTQVAFDWDNFKRLCELVPAVMHLAAGHVSNLHYAMGEDEEKNSGEASSGS